jgi:hypothetical protein
MSRPSSRRWTHVALTLAFGGAVAAGSLGGCRRIIFCDPESQACAAPSAVSAGGGPALVPSNAAGFGGEADTGFAGAGGRGAGSACEPGFDDCDHSTFNGCEAELAVDPWHCGNCGQSCSGLCVRGECRSIRYASSEPIAEASRLLLATDHVYFVVDTLLQQGEHALQRVSKGTLALETLLEGSPGQRFEKLGSGRDRLYFLEAGELWSLGFSGLGLRREQLEARAFVEHASWLYWFDDDVLRRRSVTDDAASIEETPLAAGDVQLLGHEQGLLVALTDESGVTPSYEILVMDEWPQLTPVAQGVGRVLRLRQTTDEIYWLVETEVEGGTSSELYYQSRSMEAPRRFTADLDLVDFAVDATAPLIYVTYANRSRSGLRVISRDLGQRLDVGAKHQLAPLEYDAGQLWFAFPRQGAPAQLFNEDPSKRFVAEIALARLVEQ